MCCGTEEPWKEKSCFRLISRQRIWSEQKMECYVNMFIWTYWILCLWITCTYPAAMSWWHKETNRSVLFCSFLHCSVSCCFLLDFQLQAFSLYFSASPRNSQWGKPVSSEAMAPTITQGRQPANKSSPFTRRAGQADYHLLCGVRCRPSQRSNAGGRWQAAISLESPGGVATPRKFPDGSACDVQDLHLQYKHYLESTVYPDSGHRGCCHAHTTSGRQCRCYQWNGLNDYHCAMIRLGFFFNK